MGSFVSILYEKSIKKISLTIVKWDLLLCSYRTDSGLICAAIRSLYCKEPSTSALRICFVENHVAQTKNKPPSPLDSFHHKFLKQNI